MITTFAMGTRLIPLAIPHTQIEIPIFGGTLLFPALFFFQDVITEVYGYARSRQLAWFISFALIFFVGYAYLIIHFPSPSYWHRNEAFYAIYSNLPRHLFALIIALFTGSIVNDYLMSKTKIKLRGRYLWMRSIGATMVGEAVLQIIACSFAWLGTLHFSTQILPQIMFCYTYKIIFEVACIPFTYILSISLKKAEQIDYYDYHTNFNPFIFKMGA